MVLIGPLVGVAASLRASRLLHVKQTIPAATALAQFRPEVLIDKSLDGEDAWCITSKELWARYKLARGAVSFTAFYLGLSKAEKERCGKTTMTNLLTPLDPDEARADLHSFNRARREASRGN